MKFKIDENLPVECVVLLRIASSGIQTVYDERLAGVDDATIAAHCRMEERVLITLDLDFSNAYAYPPSQHAGIIVLRSKKQDKRTLTMLLQRVATAVTIRSPAGELWIVERDRIRFRSS